MNTVIIVVLSVVLITGIISLLLSIKHGRDLSKAVTTKGMNGVGGDIINLTCPAGQTISFRNDNPTTTRAALICTGDRTCDAFWSQDGQNDNFFNPGTTMDLLAPKSPYGLASCQGKGSCSFTVPTTGDPNITVPCLKECKQIQFIGTYDCTS